MSSLEFVGGSNIICRNNSISPPLETLEGVFDIVFWIYYVIIAYETVIILAIHFVQKDIPAILLHIHVAEMDMKFPLIVLLQFIRNFLVLVEPKIEIVALSNQLIDASQHPLLSIWKGSHEY